ncbi:MAG: type II toxin-antitoxin system VapC family toxin [Chloroflexota bacterium]|jgi:predicted nucleic acid-binding protein
MVVDASVWVSYFIDIDANHASTVGWLEGVIRDGCPLIGPTILLAEVAGAIARRSNSSEMGLAASEELRSLSSLRLVPLDDELARLSAHIATTLPAKGADAVYIATAEMLDVPLITWDTEQRTRGGLLVPVDSPTDLP